MGCILVVQMIEINLCLEQLSVFMIADKIITRIRQEFAYYDEYEYGLEPECHSSSEFDVCISSKKTVNSIPV